MRIHDYGRELEIKVYDTVLIQCAGRKRVVIEEGWKSWRKYRLLALYKGDIQAHYVGRTLWHDLSDQQGSLHGPQWPSSSQVFI